MRPQSQCRHRKLLRLMSDGINDRLPLACLSQILKIFSAKLLWSYWAQRSREVTARDSY